jgi:hypothetical protein
MVTAADAPPDTDREWLRSRLARATLAALAALYGFLYVWKPATTDAVGGGDFAVYLRSGRMLLDGRSPYTTPGWNYPPLMSFLVAPLAALPFRTAWWSCSCSATPAPRGRRGWTWRALGRGPRALFSPGVTWAITTLPVAGGVALFALHLRELHTKVRLQGNVASSPARSPPRPEERAQRRGRDTCGLPRSANRSGHDAASPA